MLKKWSILLAFMMLVATAYSQSNSVDTAVSPLKDISVLDTTLNYDEFFQDFDAFMDSILSPHSYFLTSLSMAKGYYNFERKNSSIIETSKKLTYSPTLGYYHKGGLCITGTGYIVDDGHRNWYLDLANEHDVRDERYVPVTEIKKLRGLAVDLGFECGELRPAQDQDHAKRREAEQEHDRCRGDDGRAQGRQRYRRQRADGSWRGSTNPPIGRESRP